MEQRCRRRVGFGLFALTAALRLALAAEPDLQRLEASEPHMGTLFRIVLYAPDADTARRAFTAAFARVEALDRTLSDYQADSELNRLGQSPPETAIRVSDDLFIVLEASQKLAEESGGAFDVTLGPLIRLWREARREHRLPTADRIASARARSGYQKLSLDASTHTVTLHTAGMQLDVGGIAKGYAAEAALTVLRQTGVPQALVAASGDLAIGDAPPGQPGWRVGIESPATGQTGGFARVLVLRQAAVSTSGDSEQHVEIGGTRYSHIVDPTSGVGLTRRIGVTVVAPNGLWADGLDTAVGVLGAKRGLALVSRYRGASAMITEMIDGQFRVTYSPGFQKLASALP